VLQDVDGEEHVHRAVGQRQGARQVGQRVDPRGGADVQTQVARPLLGCPASQIDHDRFPSPDTNPAPDAQDPGEATDPVPHQTQVVRLTDLPGQVGHPPVEAHLDGEIPQTAVMPGLVRPRLGEELVHRP